jgi:hypothetical protein
MRKNYIRTESAPGAHIAAACAAAAGVQGGAGHSAETPSGLPENRLCFIVNHVIVPNKNFITGWRGRP